MNTVTLSISEDEFTRIVNGLRVTWLPANDVPKLEPGNGVIFRCGDRLAWYTVKRLHRVSELRPIIGPYLGLEFH